MGDETPEVGGADRSVPTGVYYHRSDYAGLGRRFVIVVVDSIVCLVAGFVILVAAALLSGGPDVWGAWLLAWCVFLWAYLALWKATPLPTLGYFLTGVRLVDMRGRRPSVVRTTFRLLLWAMGPVHPLADFIWLAGDVNQQTLRDRFAATYVVRKGAQPAGRGRIALSPYFFWGMTVFFREVRRDGQAGVSGTPEEAGRPRGDVWAGER